MKLYMLLFLPLDIIFTVIVSVLAMTESSGRSVVMFSTPLITSALLIAFMVVENTWYQWCHLAWDNEITLEYYDRGLKPITLVFKVEEHQRTILRCKQYTENPWDLGPKGNLRQVLGETWPVMLCPWIHPARVTNYFNNRPAVTDFLFREEVWKDRTMFVDPESGFTGVTVEGSAPHRPAALRPMAIDFLVAPAAARQQRAARPPPPRAPPGRRERRRTAARSSAFERGSETEEVSRRRHGDPAHTA
ncbi:hypothetical protein SLS62_003572 [Diatrype stigma]|uniref:Uncharacterized protein n=1 Tax=Diatrype stigma TaxID=117547 RepID=A0AAN9YRD6_9PEZI